MLWLECCGVNGGERSSPLLLSDSWYSSASSADKVACAGHMVACYMSSHQVIKLARHPPPLLLLYNMKKTKEKLVT